jgi:hypothetical protein
MTEPRDISSDSNEFELLGFKDWDARFAKIQASLSTGKDVDDIIRDPTVRLFCREDWPEIGMLGDVNRGPAALDPESDEESAERDLVWHLQWPAWFDVLARNGTTRIVAAATIPDIERMRRPESYSELEIEAKALEAELFPIKVVTKRPEIVGGTCSFDWGCIRKMHRALLWEHIFDPWFVFDSEGRWALWCEVDNYSIFTAPAHVIAEIVERCGGLERLIRAFDAQLECQASGAQQALVDLIRWPGASG